MFSRNFLKGLSLSFLSALVIVSCGSNNGAEIDPRAVRSALATVTLGNQVEAGILGSNAAFDSTKNCVQWVEYKLLGEKVADRIEFSGKACPANNAVIVKTDVIAQLKLSKVTVNSWNLYRESDSKLYGAVDQVAQVTVMGYELNALCGFGDTADRIAKSNNCAVKVGTQSQFTDISAK